MGESVPRLRTPLKRTRLCDYGKLEIDIERTSTRWRTLISAWIICIGHLEDNEQAGASIGGQSPPVSQSTVCQRAINWARWRCSTSNGHHRHRGNIRRTWPGLIRLLQADRSCSLGARRGILPCSCSTRQAINIAARSIRRMTYTCTC